MCCWKHWCICSWITLKKYWYIDVYIDIFCDGKAIWCMEGYTDTLIEYIDWYTDGYIDGISHFLGVNMQICWYVVGNTNAFVVELTDMEKVGICMGSVKRGK